MTGHWPHRLLPSEGIRLLLTHPAPSPLKADAMLPRPLPWALTPTRQVAPLLGLCPAAPARLWTGRRPPPEAALPRTTTQVPCCQEGALQGSASLSQAARETAPCPRLEAATLRWGVLLP